VIGDYVEINPGVTISGHVQIGRGCIIGVGAVIKNGVSIGENSFIGMGSLVNKDIPAGVVAYGSPCRVVRPNDKKPV
jgi:acetyltransferase-like isoleucine patch superfamily enzyme